MAKILVIDDDSTLRGTMRRILERLGHEVLEAEDGDVGMRMVEKESPPLVITDLLMPEKEGIETIQELKERFPDVAIIAVSGAGGGKTGPLMDAEMFGADETLAKPFSIEKFAEAVERALARDRG